MHYSSIISSFESFILYIPSFLLQTVGQVEDIRHYNASVEESVTSHTNTQIDRQTQYTQKVCENVKGHMGEVTQHVTKQEADAEVGLLII